MSKKVFKILSIDGGGIRGLIPAIILDAIEKRTAQIEIQTAENENRDPDVQEGTDEAFIPTSQLFDMIVGTSTGGILALALTMPRQGGNRNNMPQYTAEELVEFYQTQGEQIFHRSFLRGLPFANWITAKYSPEHMQRILTNHFQETRLQEALCEVIIPSYELGIARPWFFKSTCAQRDETYDFLMRDVALATAAAPTYFPPHQMSVMVRNEETETDEEHEGRFVDGGVYANHPAMCALAEIKRRCPSAQILLVSLGTGERALRYERNRQRWGAFFWLKHILDVIFDGASDTVNYQLEQLSPFFSTSTDGEETGYYRFQFQLSEGHTEMDDVSDDTLDNLQCLANILIREEENGLTEDLLQRLTADGREEFQRLCRVLAADA